MRNPRWRPRRTGRTAHAASKRECSRSPPLSEYGFAGVLPGQVPRPASKGLPVVTDITKEVVARSAEETAYAVPATDRPRTTLMVMVDREASSSTCCTTADCTNAALRLIDLPVVLISQAVSLLDVSGMGLLLVVLALRPEVRGTARAGERGLPEVRNLRVCYTVLADLLPALLGPRLRNGPVLRGR